MVLHQTVPASQHLESCHGLAIQPSEKIVSQGATLDEIKKKLKESGV
jgi:hypothetical protein